jgi:hypothetical protein
MTIKKFFIFPFFLLLFGCSNEDLSKVQSKLGFDKEIIYVCLGKEIDSVNKFGTNEIISRNVLENIQLVIHINKSRKIVNISGNKNLSSVFIYKEDTIEYFEDSLKYQFLFTQVNYSTLVIYKDSGSVFYMIGLADDSKSKTLYFEYDGVCKKS